MAKKILLLGVAALIAGIVLMPMILGYAAREAFKEKNRKASWAPAVAYLAGRNNMRFMRYQSGRVLLEKALVTFPTYTTADSAYYQIAVCYEKLDQPEMALKWHEDFLAKFPEHPWREQAQRRVALLKAQHL